MDSKKNKTWTVHLLASDGCYQIALVKAKSITEDASYIIFYDSDCKVTGKFKKDMVLGYSTRDLED